MQIICVVYFDPFPSKLLALFFRSTDFAFEPFQKIHLLFPANLGFIFSYLQKLYFVSLIQTFQENTVLLVVTRERTLITWEEKVAMNLSSWFKIFTRIYQVPTWDLSEGVSELRPIWNFPPIESLLQGFQSKITVLSLAIAKVWKLNVLIESHSYSR